tara:strand:+ start:1899 stop:2114 length:216 start_codon:yes stop_codon:yes gene_type:complete
MKSQIKERLSQLLGKRPGILNNPNEFVDKSSYIKMLDMYIESLRDIIFIVDAVKNENQQAVSSWFARFRED